MSVHLYDTSAPRKPTNLTVNSDLLRRAKERKIDVSSILEVALAEELRQREIDECKSQNKASIESYNNKMQEVGLFVDGLRLF